MSREAFDRLAGNWSGTKSLWMDPTKDPEVSESTASVALEALGKFPTIRYTWAGDGHAREGVIIVRRADIESSIDIVWFDSWHMSQEFMTLKAEPTDDGALISAKGSYRAPPGPDWGWRIALFSGGDAELRVVMHNITPDGEEQIAAELVLQRTT